MSRTLSVSNPRRSDSRGVPFPANGHDALARHIHFYTRLGCFGLEVSVWPGVGFPFRGGRNTLRMNSSEATKPPHLVGKAYLAAGDADMAKMWLRKTLKMNADNPEAVRDYRKADNMSKGLPASGKKADEKRSGLSGLFGRFRKGSK